MAFNPGGSKHRLKPRSTPRPLLLLTAGIESVYRRIRDRTKPPAFGQFTDAEGFLTIKDLPLLNHRYRVVSVLGCGTFSQLLEVDDMFRCVAGSNRPRRVALKVLNASYQYIGEQECTKIVTLNGADPKAHTPIVRFLSTFMFHKHFCIVLELLYSSLFDYVRVQPHRQLGMEQVRKIAFQLICGFAFLRQRRVIHADLKPENILLQHPTPSHAAPSSSRAAGAATSSSASAATAAAPAPAPALASRIPLRVKLGDFGNAFTDAEAVQYYENFEVQTLYYRAPEVLFGVPFAFPIDMWSLGCVLTELLIGRPLFVVQTPDELFAKMRELFGRYPVRPFANGKFWAKYTALKPETTTDGGDGQSRDEIAKRNAIAKLTRSSDTDFLSLVCSLLEYDPNRRLTPAQALLHPFFSKICPLALCVFPELATAPTAPPLPPTARAAPATAAAAGGATVLASSAAAGSAAPLSDKLVRHRSGAATAAAEIWPSLPPPTHPPRNASSTASASASSALLFSAVPDIVVPSATASATAAVARPAIAIVRSTPRSSVTVPTLNFPPLPDQKMSAPPAPAATSAAAASAPATPDRARAVAVPSKPIFAGLGARLSYPPPPPPDSPNSPVRQSRASTAASTPQKKRKTITISPEPVPSNASAAPNSLPPLEADGSSVAPILVAPSPVQPRIPAPAAAATSASASPRAPLRASNGVYRPQSQYWWGTGAAASGAAGGSVKRGSSSGGASVSTPKSEAPPRPPMQNFFVLRYPPPPPGAGGAHVNALTTDPFVRLEQSASPAAAPASSSASSSAAAVSTPRGVAAAARPVGFAPVRAGALPTLRYPKLEHPAPSTAAAAAATPSTAADDDVDSEATDSLPGSPAPLPSPLSAAASSSLKPPKSKPNPKPKQTVSVTVVTVSSTATLTVSNSSSPGSTVDSPSPVASRTSSGGGARARTAKKHKSNIS